MTSLKDLFPEHFHLPLEKRIQLRETALFVFDANVILDFFEGSTAYVNEWERLLKQLKSEGRLFLPHHAAKEVMLRADTLIQKEAHKARGICTELKSLDSKLKANSGHPHADATLLEAFSEATKALRDSIIESVKKAEDEVGNHALKLRVSDLFDGCIGPALSTEDEKAVCEDAKERHKNREPPGFEDNKPGDNLIWKQLLDEAAREKRDVIFVTKDVKADWWNRTDLTQVKNPEFSLAGPHPKLLAEFSETCGGKKLDFLRPDEFLRAFDATQVAVEESNSRYTAFNRRHGWWRRLSVDHQTSLITMINDVDFWVRHGHLLEGNETAFFNALSESYPNKLLKPVLNFYMSNGQPDNPLLFRQLLAQATGYSLPALTRLAARPAAK